VRLLSFKHCAGARHGHLERADTKETIPVPIKLLTNKREINATFCSLERTCYTNNVIGNRNRKDVNRGVHARVTRQNTYYGRHTSTSDIQVTFKSSLLRVQLKGPLRHRIVKQLRTWQMLPVATTYVQYTSSRRTITRKFGAKLFHTYVSAIKHNRNRVVIQTLRRGRQLRGATNIAP
jgi:hypothetical protein